VKGILQKGIMQGDKRSVIATVTEKFFSGIEKFPAQNPLTKKGNEIMESMKKEYGSKKGKQVFYASKNKGKIKGVD
jgi:hypothetical protein